MIATLMALARLFWKTEKIDPVHRLPSLRPCASARKQQINSDHDGVSRRGAEAQSLRGTQTLDVGGTSREHVAQKNGMKISHGDTKTRRF